MDTTLLKHEQRLLADFQRRPPGMNPVSFCTGLAGGAAALWFAPEQWSIILLGILSGALIGVWAEKRHLNEMRVIVNKLAASNTPVHTEEP